MNKSPSDAAPVAWREALTDCVEWMEGFARTESDPGTDLLGTLYRARAALIDAHPKDAPEGPWEAQPAKDFTDENGKTIQSDAWMIVNCVTKRFICADLTEQEAEAVRDALNRLVVEEKG